MDTSPIQRPVRTPSASARSGATSVPALVGVAVLVSAFNYVALTQPAYERMVRLEKQIVRLEGGVDRLISESDRPDGSAPLLARLAAQRDSVAAAGVTLDEIERLQARLSRGTDQLARLTSIDAKLAALQARAEKTDRLVTDALALADDIDQARQAAHQASSEVAQLAMVQRRLFSIAGQARDAAPVLDDLCQLTDRLIDAGPLTGDAINTAAALSELQEQLVYHTSGVAATESAMRELDAMQRQIDRSVGVIAECQTGLESLERFRELLVGQAESLADAEFVMESMRKVLVDFGGARSSVEQFRGVMIDLVLMQPAIDRAVAALKPAAQLPLSRQGATSATRVANADEAAAK